MEYSLGGEKFLAIRYKLKEWLRLDFLRGKLVDAIQRKDIKNVADAICSYVEFASKQNVIELPWYEVAEAFLLIENENRLTLPCALLSVQPNRKDIPVWEYEGRDWYWWVNILSSRYGWSMEYIAGLDPNDATGLLQEILVDDQMKKEWEWSMNEMAYPYNSTTKTSSFKPLDRPDWMQPKPTDADKDLPIFKIPKFMMPLGVIIRGNGETIIN